MNQQTIATVSFYLVHHWQEIAAYAVNGLSVAVILQWLKKKYKLDQIARFNVLKIIRLDGPRIVALLFTIFTGISTAASWLADPGNAQYVPERYAFMLMAGVYIHRFLVSPAATKLETALMPYLAAVEQIKKEEQAPIVPTPVTSVTTLPPSLSPVTDPQAKG